MIRTVIVWSCVAAAIASAPPAHAMALTRESGEYAVVTGLGGYLPLPFDYNGPVIAYYWQFMVIGGVPTIVFTDTPYRPGRKQLSFYQTWNGYNVYGLDTCGC